MKKNPDNLRIKTNAGFSLVDIMVGMVIALLGVIIIFQVLHAPDDFKLKALWEVVQEKMIRRSVPIRNLKPGKINPAGGGMVTQEILLQQGIPIETARAIVKFVKEQKIRRVQAEIQADQVRVSSPSRDDLQTILHTVKEKDFGIELKFGNYRSL